MDDATRIERFFEKYYPFVRTIAPLYQGEERCFWEEMAADLKNLRHPTAEGDSIEYYI